MGGGEGRAGLWISHPQLLNDMVDKGYKGYTYSVGLYLLGGGGQQFCVVSVRVQGISAQPQTPES